MKSLISHLLLLLFMTSYIQSVTSQCVEPGNMEMSLQERLFQADIILYGKDRALDGPCPAENPSCARAPFNAREYSNFQVYCVIKNTNSVVIPTNITILPRTFANACSQTSFPQGVSGWVHIVTIQYQNGKFYWDEINDMAAYATVYIVNTDEKLQRAADLCNLPRPMLPEGGSEVGCPALFNRTKNPTTCFKGCQRGWNPIGDGCYRFSDTSKPMTRNEAAVSCLLEDSHLLSIETREEETALTYVLNDQLDTEWWSSGVWREASTSWVWQDGVQDRPLSFTKWRQGEPSGERGDKDYIVILYRRERWGWRTVSSNAQLPFICEKARGEQSAITLQVCQDRSLQRTREGKALCSLAVQKVLLTSNAFWPTNVTSRVAEMCRGRTAYDDINCLRDVRREQNFVSQLFGRVAFNPYVGRQELSLVFASLPGFLVVCGQQYTWPRTVIVTPHLGDRKSYDSWYFRSESKMEARWEAIPDELYALIIIDMGLFSVHGAWVNIPGGNLTDSQVLQDYVPLAVATPEIPASFAFMVFRQKSPAFLTDAILKMLTYSPGRHDDFNLTKLSQEIGFDELVAVNFITVDWDPYSASYFQKQAGFSNHCPHYVQMAYRELKAPVIETQMPFSLTTDLNFQGGRETWTMCCREFSVGQSSTYVNPYGSEIASLTTESVRNAPSMNLTRGNVLLDGRDRQQTFRASCVFGRNQPQVPIDCSLPEPVDITYDWYTIIMVDLGRLPNSVPPGQLITPRLHWLVIDVPDGDVTSGKAIVPYKMAAPMDKYRHFYVIYVFKQTNKLGVVNVRRFATENCTSAVRCEFDLTGYVRFYDIQLAGANWFSVEADDFTTNELLRSKLATPADACKKRFPDTRTYGPLVVCETPQPEQPSVRPITSAATMWTYSELLVALISVVLVFNYNTAIADALSSVLH